MPAYSIWPIIILEEHRGLFRSIVDGFADGSWCMWWCFLSEFWQLYFIQVLDWDSGHTDLTIHYQKHADVVLCFEIFLVRLYFFKLYISFVLLTNYLICTPHEINGLFLSVLQFKHSWQSSTLIFKIKFLSILYKTSWKGNVLSSFYRKCVDTFSSFFLV